MVKKRKASALKALVTSNRIALHSGKKLYLSLILVSLLLCLSSYVELAFTEYTINSAYDLFKGTVSFRSVIYGMIGFTLATLLFMGIRMISQLLNNKLMLKLTYYYEDNLIGKLGSIKWEYYEKNETYVTIHEVRNHTLLTIKNMVNSTISYITAIPMGIIYGYYLIQINILTVLVYIGLVIVFNLMIAGKMFSQLGHLWEETQSYTQKKNYFFDFSGDKVSHQEYKFNRLFQYAGGLWEKCYNSEYKIRLKIFKKHEITLQTARIIFNIPYITMMIFVAYEILQGRHEIGFLIMANSLFNNIINTCLELQRNITNNKIESVFLEAYEDVMNYENDMVFNEKPFHDSFSLKDITYTYPQSSVKALDMLSMDIRKGEKLAIVGYNGSGKTTFTNILMSLTDQYEGSITDGTNPVKLRNSVSCILQDFAQYQMTIKENIQAGYSEHEFTEDEIISLLEKVGLKDTILKLENGIHTLLGQLGKGIELSKGQWQRLAIARLLANPNATIWILDEPTAYLDPISEIEIYDMIYELSGDKTVLFISHRLGFTKRADRIVVFEEGKIAEQGTHNELMEMDGIYAQMYHIQEKWYVA